MPVWFKDAEASLFHSTIKNSNGCHCINIYIYVFFLAPEPCVLLFLPQWVNISLLPPLTPPKVPQSQQDLSFVSLLTNCLGPSDVEIIHNCLIYPRLCGERQKSTLERSIIWNHWAAYWKQDPRLLPAGKMMVARDKGLERRLSLSP